MKNYPQYKRTDLIGVDSIPDHWIQNKFNRVCFFQEGPGLRNWQFTQSGIKVICVTNIVPPHIDFSYYTKYISEADYFENYQHFTVSNGDLLLASSGASWGKLSEYKSEEKVILNTSTIRLNAKDETLLSKDFIRWLLQSEYISKQLEILLTGSCQPNFGPSHLNRLQCFFPLEVKEQVAISSFLQKKTEQINNLIKSKQSLLDLLQEERTALINQAVTKGLNPNVPMKKSEIEWLGEIPEHWTISKLKYCTRINSEVLNDDTPSDKKIQYIDIGMVSKGQLTGLPEEMIFGSAPSRARRVLHNGDTIVSTVRTYLKAILFINESIHGCIGSTGFAVLSPNQSLNPKFLFYMMSSQQMIEKICSVSVGVSYPATNASDIGDMKVWLPPTSEQELIVRHIEKGREDILDIVKRTSTEIDLLSEYKTALINEAVTGKIDVRDHPINHATSLHLQRDSV